MIYLDNAATSWPKPPQILAAMQSYLKKTGASPGRSGHRLSIEAARIIYDAREQLARLFHISDPLRIIMTKNATEGLNTAIFGLLKPGDHVITSGMEHNSVMRPLRLMEKRGVDLTVIPCDPEGGIDPSIIPGFIRGNTKVICISHASNVTGTMMPLVEIGRMARDHGVLFCVDAAQTAGCRPIDVEEMNIDLLAFSGHKSLFGPPGTGGLFIREGLEKRIEPLCVGGTGSRSEMETQPDFVPDRYEAGTPNTVGVAGLLAGVDFILTTGMDCIQQREDMLLNQFLDGVRDIPGLRIYGKKNAEQRTPVVSFTIEGMDPGAVAMELESRFHILSRSGLHCAPSAHKTIGTFPQGTVRFCFGYFNTEAQVIKSVSALQHICKRRKTCVRH